MMQDFEVIDTMPEFHEKKLRDMNKYLGKFKSVFIVISEYYHPRPFHVMSTDSFITARYFAGFYLDLPDSINYEYSQMTPLPWNTLEECVMMLSMEWTDAKITFLEGGRRLPTIISKSDPIHNRMFMVCSMKPLFGFKEEER